MYTLGRRTHTHAQPGVQQESQHGVSSVESPQPPCSPGRIHHFPGQLIRTESGLLPLVQGTQNNTSLTWGSPVFLTVGFFSQHSDTLPSRLFCYQAPTLSTCLQGILAMEFGTGSGQ